MASQPRGVRLSVQLQDHYANNVVDGFRFTVVATDPVLMPAEIFRYLPSPDGVSAVDDFPGPQGAQGPQGPQDLEFTGQFDGVCSSPDLEEFPVGAPATGTVPPYFRLPVVDLLFRSRAEAEQALAAIKEDVNRLIRSMNANDSLGPPQHVWIGAEPSGDPDDVYYWH